MAEESLEMVDKVKKSFIWTATITYYIYYYCLYSLLVKIGINSEIHSCSIAYMKSFLDEYYSKEDTKFFEKAFKARIDLQYYSNRAINLKEIISIKEYSKIFYIKTKEALYKINEKKINEIRKDIQTISQKI